MSDVRDPAPYDAFVIGSAAYMFHWLKKATAFVKRHRAILAKSRCGSSAAARSY